MRPQGRPLAWIPPSMNNNRLENTKRRGFFLIKYGTNSNGKASRPSKAAGLRNSIPLFEQTDRRQGREDEIPQIAIGDVERIVDALVAETTDFQVVMRQPRLIIALRAAAPLISDFTLGLAIDQSQTAIRKGRLDFLARQDLNDSDIEVKSAQRIESLLKGDGGHEEIRNEYGLTRPMHSL